MTTAFTHPFPPPSQRAPVTRNLRLTPPARHPRHVRRPTRMGASPPPTPPPSRLRVSRRQAVQLLNALLGATTLTLLVKMREQARFLSLQTVLSAVGLGPPTRMAVPPAAAASAGEERYREALRYVERVDKEGGGKCPDFPRGGEWINSRPLNLRGELKGKVVLLDFFTYCCINCQHVLPKLKEIEGRYGQDGSGGVVVVGVHSAKFTAERETRNVAAAVERYGVEHPVLNDERMEMWNGIGVTSWPTLVLVGPRGNFLAVWTGERQEEDVDTVIAAALEYYGGSIDHRPLPAAPKRNASLRRPVDSPLRYPGKIAVAGDGKSLYVSDSGNNRIIQLDLGTRKVLRVFGSGEPGLTDAFDPMKAAFNSPQGVVEYKGVLYVADTESHAVRAIDLSSGKVNTIGGTGEQGFDYGAGAIGQAQALSSPWDVEVSNGVLYVAMAGTHQIWSVALADVGQAGAAAKSWQVFSGSGRELEKNSSNGRTAGWAQPSHLSVSRDGMLFVADSESSSVRVVDTNEGSHPTQTLAGGDGLLPQNLFAFGDREGRGSTAKFQHPLAVCFDDQRQRLYVADSYNHRIKVVEEDGSASNFCGNGSPGLRDGGGKQAMFWEPAGLALSVDGKQLYVADTNNFVIRIIDTDTRAVSTLEVTSSVPERKSASGETPLIPNRRRAVQIPCGPVSAAEPVKFEISIPDKSHFTPGTTSRYQVNVKAAQGDVGSKVSRVTCLQKGTIKTDGMIGSFQADLSKRVDEIGLTEGIEVEAIVYYCTEADDVCRIESDIFDVKVNPNAASGGLITHSVKPKAVPKVKI